MNLDLFVLAACVRGLNAPTFNAHYIYIYVLDKILHPLCVYVQYKCIVIFTTSYDSDCTVVCVSAEFFDVY